jgi:hypothetical protein
MMAETLMRHVCCYECAAVAVGVSVEMKHPPVLPGRAPCSYTSALAIVSNQFAATKPQDMSALVKQRGSIPEAASERACCLAIGSTASL